MLPRGQRFVDRIGEVELVMTDFQCTVASGQPGISKQSPSDVDQKIQKKTINQIKLKTNSVKILRT